MDDFLPNFLIRNDIRFSIDRYLLSLHNGGCHFFRKRLCDVRTIFLSRFPFENHESTESTLLHDHSFTLFGKELFVVSKDISRLKGFANHHIHLQFVTEIHIGVAIEHVAVAE